MPGAFIWDSTNHMRNMNTVFVQQSYPRVGPSIDAYAIDNNGDIVGCGSNNGTQQAFLIKATVPEPSTLLLAATGIAGLLAYAWRKRK